MPTNDPNVGIAFALVCGAGMSTAIGAAIVFSPTLVKYASRKTLAAALGLSAGVMMYVSFVEILQKSTLSFVDAGHPEDDAYIYSTGCFFAGVILMILLNHLVSYFLGGHHHHSHPHHEDEAKNNTQPVSNDESEPGIPTTTTTTTAKPPTDGTEPPTVHAHAHTTPVDVIVPGCPCCADDPVADLEELQHMAANMETFEKEQHHHWEGVDRVTAPEEEVEGGEQGHAPKRHSTGDSSADANATDHDDDDQDSQGENQKLMRMSINTAVAIGLHNFPEGLATFVAALNDPRVGAVLAIAIAIHNIPEGLCVAMPIYYATGNRWKAFGWAVLSGVSEPVAALLGWAVLANSFTDTMFAILFGIVAGMMVIISARELLPTAHRYDPEDTVVTYSFIIGMGIMAVSLVLFLL